MKRVQCFHHVPPRRPLLIIARLLVFLYLDSMLKTPPGPEDNERAASVVSTRRSEVSRVSSRRPPQPINGDEDVRSDLQEGQSELARTIPINTTGFVRVSPYSIDQHVHGDVICSQSKNPNASLVQTTSPTSVLASSLTARRSETLAP